jgi:hypothetical protein
LVDAAASGLADAAAWITPATAGRTPRVERWARSIDWSLASAWELGRCGVLTAEQVRRSARGRARETPEVWVRPRASDARGRDGLLALRNGDGRPVDSSAASALAELCARSSAVECERELLAHASSERSIRPARGWPDARST